jgi:hypothetical protein
MLGNSAHVTPDLYAICCDQASVLLTGLAQDVAGTAELASASTPAVPSSSHPLIQRAVGREPSLRLIAVDIPRTYPTLAFFHADGPLAAPLHRVLEAYACFRPDVGYIQGMSYLAGLLLLFVEDEATVFRCFCSLLQRHLFFDLFRVDKELVSY